MRVLPGRPRTRRTAQQRRIAAQARAFNGVPLGEPEPWQAQLQRDPQSQEPYEGALQQRIRLLTESQRREADDIGHLDTKINQLRHEFQEAMTESALALQ